MDRANPVVTLCAAGMDAEAQGQSDLARVLFEDAWRARVDDFDACVAAHYLARHQRVPEDVLRWSHLALEHALAAGDDRVRGFLASLHLNLGRAHEDVGELLAARRHYELAHAGLVDVVDDAYRAELERGVGRGLFRVDRDIPSPAPEDITAEINEEARAAMRAELSAAMSCELEAVLDELDPDSAAA